MISFELIAQLLTCGSFDHSGSLGMMTRDTDTDTSCEEGVHDELMQIGGETIDELTC